MTMGYGGTVPRDLPGSARARCGSAAKAVAESSATTTATCARFTMDDGLASNIVRVIVETTDGARSGSERTAAASVAYVDGSFQHLAIPESGLSSDLIRSIYEDDGGGDLGRHRGPRPEPHRLRRRSS